LQITASAGNKLKSYKTCKAALIVYAWTEAMLLCGSHYRSHCERCSAIISIIQRPHEKTL